MTYYLHFYAISSAYTNTQKKFELFNNDGKL